MNELLIIAVILVIILFTYEAVVNLQELKNGKNELYERLEKSGLQIGKRIPVNDKIEVIFDYTKEKMVILDFEKVNKVSISFDDFLDCELIENNSTVQKGGFGRAVVGGVIAGGVGAIVGASTRKSANICEMLRVRLILKNTINALINIDFLVFNTKRDSKQYKESFENAQELYATIFSIISRK